MCTNTNTMRLVFCTDQTVDVGEDEEADAGDEGGDAHGLGADHGGHQLPGIHCTSQ